MGPLSVGTDGAGSVRIPAAFCGNFGLKPSFGRVPAYPLSPMGTVAHLGPHTMSVRDAALMMNVLKQPDARDWTSLPPDASDYLVGLDDGIRGLRIAYSPTLGYAKGVDPEVAAAVAAAVHAAAGAGRPRRGRSTRASTTRWTSRTGLWFVGLVGHLEHADAAQQQALADPDFARRGRAGLAASARSTCQRLTLRRGALGSHMRQFMQRFDLLVTPAVAVPAFEARPAGHTPLTPHSDARLDAVLLPVQPDPAAGLHHPLRPDPGRPADRAAARRPMFGDALVLRAARAYETVRPIARPPQA